MCVATHNIQALFSCTQTKEVVTDMSQETGAIQEPVQIQPKQNPKQTKAGQLTLQELLDSLKNVQDDIGQICELMSEEKVLVAEFFESFLKLVQPLSSTLPVSTAILPKEMGEVAQALVDPLGHLILLYQDGYAKIENLREDKHRDLMIGIVKDVMPKTRLLISAHRQKIGERMKFLSSITKEMQKVSRALCAATTAEPQQ
jgi:hypothetical protein